MRKEILAYKLGVRVLENGDVIVNGKQYKGNKNQGYYRFQIYNSENKRIFVFVHRLQAFQKYGLSMFKEGIVVRHLNSNPVDNSWDNIAIGTHSDNMMDIPQHIRLAKALHATSFIRKYDRDSVKRFYLDNGKSYKKTMAEFGISSKGTLNYILKK